MIERRCAGGGGSHGSPFRGRLVRRVRRGRGMSRSTCAVYRRYKWWI